MIPVTVTIQFMRDGNKESRRVRLELDATVESAIQHLIRELGLLPDEAYQLVRQRQNLSESDKLYEAGVQENDILQLVAFDSNATMMGKGASANILNRLGSKTNLEPLSIKAALIALPSGNLFALRHTRAMIGRADPSVGYPADMLDADLTALDSERSVSRPHALIIYSGGAFTIRDMYSQSGVMLNGQRIPVNTAHPLRNGDRLKFGDVEMRFQVD